MTATELDVHAHFLPELKACPQCDGDRAGGACGSGGGGVMEMKWAIDNEDEG